MRPEMLKPCRTDLMTVVPCNYESYELNDVRRLEVVRL